MKIRLNGEFCCYLLICLIISFDIIKSAILKIIRNIVVLPGHLDTIILYVIYIIVIGFALRYIVTRINRKCALFTCLVFILLFVSIIRIGGYENYYISLIRDVAFCMLAFFTIRSLRDINQLYRLLRYTAFFITISMLIVFGSGLQDTSYSMYYGYAILPAAVISCTAVFNLSNITTFGRILHIVNFVVATGLCVMAGARGPLLSIAIIMILQIFVSEYDLKKRLFYILCLCVLSLILILFMDTIMFMLSDYASNKNFSMRLFNKFFEGEMLSDSGRIRFVENGFNGLNMILGVGIGNDRIYIAKSFGYLDPTGYYPHNLFVEFLLQFGYLFGGIIIILFISMTILAIKRSYKTPYGKLLWIFLGIGVIPLMVSGSYISNAYFFCYLAICINILEGTSLFVKDG